MCKKNNEMNKESEQKKDEAKIDIKFDFSLKNIWFILVFTALLGIGITLGSTGVSIWIGIFLVLPLIIFVFWQTKGWQM